MAVEWWKQPRKRPRVVAPSAGSRFVECPGCSRHVFAALLNQHLDSGCASATAAPPAGDEPPARAETVDPAADSDSGGVCDDAVSGQGAKNSNEPPRGDQVVEGGSTAHEDALDALGHELTCAICCDPYENPHLLPCGHKFCLDCVLGAFRQRHECPICRLPAQKRSLVKDTTIAAIVDVWHRARRAAARDLR